MARTFLTTLGINPYLDCRYRLRDTLSAITPFVQEALASTLCSDWSAEDRILVFCTEEATSKNWLDQSEANPHGNFDVGLQTRLHQAPTSAAIARVPIPGGSTEAEIMEIFQTVADVLEKEDEVILDITHSFRSLPLLHGVILNYAKVLKGIRVSGIYYGAFETLGRLDDVRKVPVEERIAPVFDLTPYDALLDWARAVDGFVSYGSTKSIQELVTKKIAPILTETQGQEGTARGLRDLLNRLHPMAMRILTARLPDIENFTSLEEQVSALKGQTLLPPLSPLLDLIVEKTQPFAAPSPEEKGFAAVEWCIAHNLIPQGYTLLQEAIVSGSCRLFGYDSTVSEKRDFITALLNVEGKKAHRSEWREPLESRRKDAEAILACCGPAFQALASSFSRLTGLRNDINHAGARRGHKSHEALVQQLKEQYQVTRAAWFDFVTTWRHRN
jgi:CRISPR-associated Csx2 family protein